MQKNRKAVIFFSVKCRGYKEMSSVLADHAIAPFVYEPKCVGMEGGGGVAGLSQ
jgi:hypothetical protein